MLSKKYTSFFILLLFSFSAYSAQQGKQITTPQYIPDPNSTEIVDLLLTNPAQVLSHIDQEAKTFITNIETTRTQQFNNRNQNIPKSEQIQIFLQNYENIFIQEAHNAQQRHPLSLLDECPSPCKLSRIKKPHLRNAFENRVCTLLAHKITSHPGSPITFTSFASGSGFSELIAVTKTLAQIPNATLHVNLIEEDNFPWTYAQKFYKKTPEVLPNNTININYTDVIQYIKNMSIEHQNHNIQTFLQAEDLIALNDLIFKYLLIKNQSTQWIQWLQHTFPQAHISLSLFDTCNNYLQHTEDNKLSYPDVIACVDILCDDNLKINLAHQHYSFLCLFTLKEHPSSSNIWLDHNCDYKNKPSLMTMSLKPICKHSIPITGNSPDKIFAYKTAEYIPTPKQMQLIEQLRCLYLLANEK